MNVDPTCACTHCPAVKAEAAPEASDCCSTPNKKPASPFVKALELVCRVAIAIFAAIIQPIMFAISFTVGSAIGIGYALYLKLFKKDNQQGDSQPVCAQGFMEYLSGMKYPAGISTVVTGVFIAEHVVHNPCFYVPFAGFFVGIWAGTQATLGACTLAGHVATWMGSDGETKEQKPCCQV